METHTYLTDLSDAEWRLLEPLLPAPAGTGRPGLLEWSPNGPHWAVERSGQAWERNPGSSVRW